MIGSWIHFQQSYKFTYNNGQTTADGCYSIPDGTSNADKSPVCSFDFFSESNQNSGSYHESLRREMSGGFGGWGGSFSASSDFNEVYENSFSGSTMSHLQFGKHAYASNAGDNVNLFSEAFQEDVKHLSLDATNPVREARIFFDCWGTHVVYRMCIQVDDMTSNHHSLQEHTVKCMQLEEI